MLGQKQNERLDNEADNLEKDEVGTMLSAILSIASRGAWRLQCLLGLLSAWRLQRLLSIRHAPFRVSMEWLTLF